MIAEALWVSCENSQDRKKFMLDDFAKWLMRNIPLLHTKNSGFKLPKTHAKQNADYYYSGAHYNQYLDKLRKSSNGFYSQSGVHSPV